MAKPKKAVRMPYLGDEVSENLVHMNTELLSELWILRDRVTVLEHLLEQKGTINREDLNNYVPSDALADELENERNAIVKRVIGSEWEKEWSVDALIKRAKG